MTNEYGETVGRPHLRHLLGRRFRANRRYELIEHARLPGDRRAAFASLESDPDYYGLLVPKEHAELGILAVDHDSASLFLDLSEPRSLPDEVRVRLGSNRNKRIAQFVLDGVLEVEFGDRFVTGPSAHPQLFEAPVTAPRPASLVAGLSYEAMRRAQDLPIDDPERLSSWLYAYHCLPASPAWLQRLGRPERIDDALGLQSVGPTHRILDEAYSSAELISWRFWRRSDAGGADAADEPSYKLYISPHPDALGEAFHAVVPRLAQAGVSAFKMGKDVYGLLRPDKLIAYFGDYDALREMSASLAIALAGCPAHGVPFTAALSDDGLLSWGMDPPRSAQIPGWKGIESWRVWVTNRLARAILRAKGLGSGALEPWHYAMLRLELEGVRTESWLPSTALWLESGAGS